MTGRLDGKVAFITGAARGQGRANPVVFLSSDDARLITADHLSIEQGAQYF